MYATAAHEPGWPNSMAIKLPPAPSSGSATPVGSGEAGKAHASSASTPLDDVDVGVVCRPDHPVVDRIKLEPVHQQHLQQEYMPTTACDILSDYFEAAPAPAPAQQPRQAPPTVPAAASPARAREELKLCIDSKERLRWTPQLHHSFCKALDQLGGPPNAKPKDILNIMAVPGLTLAHVKSHLQKHRQQRGVSYVPHSTRNSPNATRRFHKNLQQPHQQQQQQGGWMAAGRSRSSSDSEGHFASAKRARTSSHANGAFITGGAERSQYAEPWQQGAAAASFGGNPADSLLHSIQAQANGQAAQLPVPQPLPPSAHLQQQQQEEGGLDKLLALAELASEQHDELEAERRAVDGQAAQLGLLAEQLAAAQQHQAQQQQQQQHQAGVGLDASFAPLLGLQVELQEAVRDHMRRGAALMEEVRAFQLVAQELLAHQAAQQAAQQARQARQAQQVQLAAATAALRAAVEQQGGAAVVGQSSEAASLVSHLLAALASASVSAVTPGMPAPALQPAPHAVARLAQLQCLFQSAAMLSAQQ